MVLQKRLYYGFNGFQAPFMPRGSRSARGKRPVSNNIKRDQMCAFELLATVAGKLLLEEKSASAAGEFKSPSIKSDSEKDKHDCRTSKLEPCEQGRCDKSALPSDAQNQRLSQNFPLKEFPKTSNSVMLGPASVVKSEIPGENIYKSVINLNKNDTRNSIPEIHRYCSHRGHSPSSEESHMISLEDGTAASQWPVLQRDRKGMDGSFADFLCMEDLLESDCKHYTLVSSDGSVEFQPSQDHISHSISLPSHHNDMELMDRDDDEKSSRCVQPNAATLKPVKPQQIGNRRIRKLLASKFWKVGPTLPKDGEFSKMDAKSKSVFHSRKMGYKHQRTQRSPLKRRKPSLRSSRFTHIGEIGNLVLSMSPEKSIKGEPSSPVATLHGGQQSQLKSDDYKVKFGIKSFKLPELFIEMPESATVGELKRTVLETLTAILCNGLRVGVILKGKKVRDDSKTLLQTGISHGAKLDNLGFCLEPISSRIPELDVPEELPCSLDHCDVHKPLSWLPAAPSVIKAQSDHTGSSVTTDLVQSEQNVISSTDAVLPDKTTGNLSALVPPATMEPLAVIPVHRKSNRSEFAQRRTRRPFTVSEVEALVQAVEKIGTGRWRDVKLQAFDNSNHRTYVDLKDKWKTLVHTARISPQQRRGEPVPQELLDRVLSAHAYWSQQQAKLQVKQQPNQCLLL